MIQIETNKLKAKKGVILAFCALILLCNTNLSVAQGQIEEKEKTEEFSEVAECKDKPDIFDLKCIVYKYDSRNRKIEQRYLGEDGAIVHPHSGPGIVQYSYDGKDRIIEERYYRDEWEFMSAIGRVEFIYDQEGKLIKEIQYRGDGSVRIEIEK